MKIIEGMKQIKALHEKAEDLRVKAHQYSADYENETPTYGTSEQQRQQVGEWMQAHSDIVKEILRLQLAIQRTNLATEVTIELGGKSVTKTIAEWIHRRGQGRDRQGLADVEREMWAGLGRKEAHMKEGVMVTSTNEKVEQKIRRYYSPVERDEKVDLYRSEPGKIDATLEVVNAVTDLIEGPFSQVPAAEKKPKHK